MMAKQLSIREQSYFQWLKDLVDREELENYYWALKLLFQTEFYAVHAMDENRAADGKTLRDRYVFEECSTKTEEDFFYADMSGPTNMLEVMIGLTERMDAELYLPSVNDRQEYVDSFWELFRNAGFDQFKDCDIFDRWNPTVFNSHISKILDRKYHKDGHGGFFPLKGKLSDDQRDIEMWYQMQAYLIENYPVGEEDPK